MSYKLLLSRQQITLHLSKVSIQLPVLKLIDSGAGKEAVRLLRWQFRMRFTRTSEPVALTLCLLLSIYFERPCNAFHHYDANKNDWEGWEHGFANEQIEDLTPYCCGWLEDYKELNSWWLRQQHMRWKTLTTTSTSSRSSKHWHLACAN